MKKSLLTLLLTVACMYSRSQCVISCSNYAVSQITYSTFPSNGPNVTSSFLPNTDDGSTGAIPIGFTFKYYCTDYTDVYICSNGFLQFTPVSWAHGNYVHPTAAIPSVGEPNNMVAFNATDLDPGVGGSVSYVTVGSAPNRIFIVTYDNVPAFGTNTVNTGQIILYETTNIIEIHTTTAYGAPNQSYSGSQGIENAGGSKGVPVPGRSNSSSWFPGSNTAYRFTFLYEPKAPGLISGDTSLCQGGSATYSIAAIPSATAYNWTSPFGWQPMINLNSATYTMSTSGQLSVSASYSCGTSPVTTLAVKIIPAPAIAINSASPTILCSGIPVTFSVSGADTYTLDPGGITGQMPLTHMPLATTVYSVTGTSTAGCISVKPATITITVNETPTVTVNSGQVCSGQAFVMTPAGAPPPFQFQGGFASVTQTLPGVYSYTVVGTATNGCKSAPATSSLVVHALPVVTAFATRTLICKGETSTISATGGTTYAWTHTASTSNSMVVNPFVVNNYSVTATDVNGCSKGALVTVNVNPCSGLAESGEGVKFLNVYPNPSSDHYVVESVSAVTFEVFDITGRKVHSGKIEAGEKTGIAHRLPPGQYLLRAVSDNGSHQSMVLIKN